MLISSSFIFRPNINDVLDLSIRIDDEEVADQRLENEHSKSPPFSPSTKSNMNSVEKTYQNSLPNTHSNESVSNPTTLNDESPPIGYAKTGTPGSAQRYVRT